MGLYKIFNRVSKLLEILINLSNNLLRQPRVSRPPSFVNYINHNSNELIIYEILMLDFSKIIKIICQRWGSINQIQSEHEVRDVVICNFNCFNYAVKQLALMIFENVQIIKNYVILRIPPTCGFKMTKKSEELLQLVQLAIRASRFTRHVSS